MKNSRLVDFDRLINEARMVAGDVAGALDNLSALYAELAALRQGGGEEEKRLAATFSTIQAQAAKVVMLLEESLG